MEEKQTFTTFDSVTVLSLLAGVLVLVASIVTNAMIDQKGLRAKKAADHLAAQILVGSHEVLTANGDLAGSRKPASLGDGTTTRTGEMGADPWGSPYFYQIWGGGSGTRPDAVLVLSYGPNHVRDTSDDHLVKDADGRIRNIALQGDDVGVVESAH